MTDPWLEKVLGGSTATQEEDDPWLRKVLGDTKPDLEAAREVFDPKTTAGTLGEIAKAGPRGFGKFFVETLPKAGAFGARAAEDAVMAFGGSPVGVTNLSPEELENVRSSMDVPLDDPDVQTTSQQLYQLGKAGGERMDRSFLGRDPRYNRGKAGFATDVAEAVGGSIPYAAAWTVSAPAVLMTSMGQSGVSAYEQAKRKGADEDQARQAGYLSAPGGLIEALGAERVAGRILRQADDLAEGGLSYVAKNWAAGTAGESAEEFAQALLDEGVAQAIYEKDPFAWEQISRQAQVGGVAGFVLTGLALAMGVRPRGKPPTEAEAATPELPPGTEIDTSAPPAGDTLTGFTEPPKVVRLRVKDVLTPDGAVIPEKIAEAVQGAPEAAQAVADAEAPSRKVVSALVEGGTTIKQRSAIKQAVIDAAAQSALPTEPVAEPEPEGRTQAKADLAAFLKTLGLKANERPQWLYKSEDAVNLLREAGETIPGEKPAKTSKEQAREELDKAVEDLGKFRGRLYSNPLDPEYIGALAKVVSTGAKYVYQSFKDLVADLLKRGFSPDEVRKIAPIARAEWNRANVENPKLGLAPTVAEIDAMVEELSGTPSRPLGRGLANPGVSQDVRREFETTDEATGTPETRARAPLRDAAARATTADPEGSVVEADRILNRSEGTPKEAEEYLIRNVIEQEGKAALAAGDPARLARNRLRQTKLRAGRTEVARTLGIQDPLLHEGNARALGRIVQSVINADPTEGKPTTIEQATKDSAEVIAALKQKGIDAAKLITELEAAPTTAPTVQQAGQAVQVINVVQAVQQAQKNRRAGRKIGAAVATLNDQVFEYWRNMIQTGLGTPAANIISNKANAARVLIAERFAENILRSVFGPLTLGKIKGPQWGEFIAMYKAVDLAMKEWWTTGFNTMMTESPVFDILIGQESRDKIESGERRGKIGTSASSSKTARVAGRVIRGAETLNRMDDQATKALVFRLAAVANAYREGKRRGFKGKALDNFINAQMRDPQSAAFKAAVQDANLATMAQELGPTTAAVEKLVLQARNDIPGIRHIARYILPFVTFPFRSTAQAFDATVIGSGKLAVRTIRGLQTGNWQGVGQLAARNAIAWGIVAALWNWFDDYLTGTEEIKWLDKNMQERTIPAYSIRIPGTDTWLSYGRIEPFASAIGLTVDAVKGIKDGEPFRAPKQLLSIVTDKTFLETVGTLVEAAQNPDQALQILGRIGIRTAAGLVPNLYRATAASATPYRPQRRIDKDDLTGSLATRLAQETQIPQRFGALKDVPQYDTWGREIQGRGFASLAATRIKEADIRDGDKIILAWNKAHPDERWRPGEPARDYKDSKGKERKMTDEQFAQFTREAGKLADKRITERRFNTANPSEKTIEKVKDILEKARKETKERLRKTWRTNG